jgi:hypothetical protein
VQGELKSGDTFVVCSDGLTGPVEDEEIHSSIASHPPQAACDALIDMALERGASDNVTVIVVRCMAERDRRRSARLGGGRMTGRGQFPRSTQNVPQGTQLNNMFEIDELITAGGMGEVYRGHNIQTHDPVAIKIVLPEFAQDDLILELFRKEARILNHLHHEAIVRYYVFSIDATLGLPFLVMEFVDGPSLAERIKEGPFDTASVATLQRHLADGLEKAHQAGVIHRDIAPDNVICPKAGSTGQRSSISASRAPLRPAAARCWAASSPASTTSSLPNSSGCSTATSPTAPTSTASGWCWRPARWAGRST